MGRQFRLDITETAHQLSQALQDRPNARAKERLQMLYWIKTGKVRSRAEVAALLQRDPATIGRWVKKYREGGLMELLEVKKAPGKAPALSAEHLLRLQTRLQDPSAFSSYSQIQQWLAIECGLNLKYKTVYKWAHDRLQFRLKNSTSPPLTSHPQSQLNSQEAQKKLLLP